MILKLNPVVPISNRKLFRFYSSLGRVSHFDLNATDEVLLIPKVLLRTHFLHYDSGLSIFSINFINASVWY